MKIYIHVGPPKSGTSAIQYWLLNNRKVLLKNGIYYPKHKIDSNGVGSGNLLSLYETDKYGELSYSEDKKNYLVSEARRRGCKTLVLSSEYFFERINFLAKKIPESIFIAYIRFPLESIESDYRQSIKRKKQIKKFNPPSEPNMLVLRRLRDYLELNGKSNIEIRLYSPSLFVGGDLLKDFMNIFGLVDLVTKTAPRINSSYSLIALEFKRWLNQFNIRNIERIDNILQAKYPSNDTYTLLNKNRHKQLKSHLLKVMDEFCERFGVSGWKIMREEIVSAAMPSYYSQSISELEFLAVIRTINESDSLVLADIYISIIEHKKPVLHPEFIELVQKNVSIHIKITKAILLFLSRIRLIVAKTILGKELKKWSNRDVEFKIEKFRSALSISQSLKDADILRELAFVFEQNGLFEHALMLMKRARELRPEGKIINSKIEEYEDLVLQKNIN